MRATGAIELRRIAAACYREAAGRQTADDIGKGVRGANGLIRAAVAAGVMADLPKRGGLNAWVAEAGIDFSPITGGKAGGVKVTVGKAGHDLRGLDEGLVIHPFYGHGPWFNQPVIPHSISDPIRNKGGDALQQAVQNAASAMAERIARA